MKPIAAVGVPKWAAPRGPRIDPDTPHGVPCPHCAGDSRVIDSRPRHGTIQRRRVCDNCGRRFTTFEIVSDLNPGALAKKFRKQAIEIRNLAGFMDQILSGIENPDAMTASLEAERAKQ